MDQNCTLTDILVTYHLLVGQLLAEDGGISWMCIDTKLLYMR